MDCVALEVTFVLFFHGKPCLLIMIKAWKMVSGWGGSHSGHCVESIWLEVTPTNTVMDTRGSGSRGVVTVGLCSWIKDEVGPLAIGHGKS